MKDISVSAEIEGLSDLYQELEDLKKRIKELEKKQPNGPYLVGKELKSDTSRKDS